MYGVEKVADTVPQKYKSVITVRQYLTYTLNTVLHVVTHQF